MLGTAVGIGLVLVACAAAVYARLTRRMAPSEPAVAARPHGVPIASEPEVGATAVEPPDAACIPADLPRIASQFFRVALNLPQGPMPFTSPDADLLAACRDALPEAIEHRKYFPRRPMLMPQLMRAVNDDTHAPRQLAAIILQDPVLAGDVLTVANSCYYRPGAHSVDTIDNALMLLGTDGLKVVLANCLLRPVVRQGTSDRYSALLWSRSELTAAGAYAYAELTGACDRYSAHLLGLIGALGPLMLSRYVRDMERRAESRAPSSHALVVYKLVTEHGAATTRLIAESWGLPVAFQQAMAEQADRVVKTSPLGLALRCAQHLATCTLLAREGLIPDAEAQNVARIPDVAAPVFDAVWQAVQAGGTSTATCTEPPAAPPLQAAQA